MRRVGFLILATGRYLPHAAKLVQSLRRYFQAPETSQEFFIYTDACRAPEGTVRLQIDHRPFPYAVLRRYHHILRHREAIESCSHLVCLDADMKITGAIGEEILGERVAILHPGFFNRGNKTFPYERDPKSAASIPRGAGEHYYCAGVQGGETATYLAMAETLRHAIDSDLARGLMPIWHDESYLNRYLLDHPPTRVLSPAYCYPEFAKIPFDRKIVAVEKDHRYARGFTPFPFREWMLAALRTMNHVRLRFSRSARSSP